MTDTPCPFCSLPPERIIAPAGYNIGIIEVDLEDVADTGNNGGIEELEEA